MTRTLSPAEHQQRVEAARARWRDRTGQTAAAAGGAGAALGIEAARRHTAREGAKILAGQARESVEGVAQERYARAGRLEDRASRVEAGGRRVQREARGKWPFERLYQHYGREARLDRTGALDIDTGRTTPRLPQVEWGFAGDDAAVLRARAKRGEEARAQVAPFRDRKAKRLVAGAAWQRRAEEWTAVRTVKKDPLRQAKPEVRAEFEARVQALMTPNDTGKRPLSRKAAEKEVRRRVPAFRFQREKKTITFRPKRGAEAGARSGWKRLAWPKEVDRSTAAAAGDRIALRYSPQGPLGEVSADIRELAARTQAKGDAWRRVGARMGQRALRAAPRRLTVASAAGIAAAGAAAGAGLYAVGRWGKEKLAKAADKDPPSPSSTAQALGEVFRRWMSGPPTEVGNPASLAPLYEAVKQAFETAAGRALPPEVTIGDPGGGSRRRLVFDLDERSPDIERQAQQHAAEKVTRISREAREAIRAVIVKGGQEGLDIPTQARMIRDSIGLTTAQAAWVQNYRSELEAGFYALAQNRALRDRRHDRLLDRMMEQRGRLSDEQIDRMVDSYHRRILAFRATTIARTEAVGAANIGRLAGARAFLEANPDVTVIKRWISTDDDRTRPDHEDLNGREVVGLDTPFLVTPKDRGAPYEIRFPHDPLAPPHSTISCRCTWSIRIVPAGTDTPPSRLVAEAV